VGLAILRMNTASKTAAVAVLVCAAIEWYALSDRSTGQPRNLDIRRYVLGEIYDNHRAEQRFLVKADGLSSVTIYPRPASPSPTGTVVLHLHDVTAGHDHDVAIRRVPLASMLRAESFTLRFPRQPSVHREYALTVTVEGGSDGQGIGLLATRGEGYAGGTLFVNGRRRFGDLVFETTVDDAMSNFGSIASQLAAGGVPFPRVVLLLVLVAKYVALFAIIRAFAPAAGQAALEAPTPPSLPA
jgi:hypothetical protein